MRKFNYSKFSLRQKSKKIFITDWAFKEGVFLTSEGKYIARIKTRTYCGGINYKTISQHSTEKEALEVFKKNKRLLTI